MMSCSDHLAGLDRAVRGSIDQQFLLLQIETFGHHKGGTEDTAMPFEEFRTVAGQ